MELRECSTAGLEGGGVVVVGVKRDAESRELLTWALVKAAQQKDRVFALHVLPFASRFDTSHAPAVALMKELHALLAAYEGFCSLKNIDLQVKFCRGSSISKALVKEATSLGATKLVLGAARKGYVLGSPCTSVAKYCAKKLPPSCCVLAVNNGKIVFQKAPSVSRNQVVLINKTKPFSEGSFLLNDSNSTKYCLLPEKKLGHKKSNSVVEGCVLLRASHNSRQPTCKVGSVKDDISNEESDGARSMALIPVQCGDWPMLVLMHEFPEIKPGWPLLRKAILQRKCIESEKLKLPVVEWAMQLPSRHQVTSSNGCLNGDLWKECPSLEWEVDGGIGTMVHTRVDDQVHHYISEDNAHHLPKELEFFHEKYASTCRLFTYQELAVATSDFSPDNLIGKGGSSHVYKGLLSDGRELAVKRLKKSEEALAAFIQEIEIVTTLHHENISSLFGFCFQDGNLMLVYDFFPRGSLEENLHGFKSEDHVLSLFERYKIAIGTAEALAYLHNDECGQSIIHKDVKSSNILLSDDLEPQLSDFGLAAWVSTSSSYVTCNDVAGTFGYLAPEYFMSGKINEKIDVYAFGVILLELLSGRKPIDNGYPKGKESLVMWAKPILQSEKPKQVLDPKFGSHYDEAQVERMILAASLCIRRTPKTRPKISVVLKLLKGDETVTKWARLQGLCDDCDEVDEETTAPASAFQSHLNLALLDVEDDALSVSSTEHCFDHILAQGSLEAYLQDRWSRSSSFD